MGCTAHVHEKFLLWFCWFLPWSVDKVFLSGHHHTQGVQSPFLPLVWNRAGDMPRNVSHCDSIGSPQIKQEVHACSMVLYLTVPPLSLRYSVVAGSIKLNTSLPQCIPAPCFSLSSPFQTLKDEIFLLQVRLFVTLRFVFSMNHWLWFTVDGEKISPEKSKGLGEK